MSKLKAYYIEVDEKIIRLEAKNKKEAMYLFHEMGYICVWADVKLVPAWEEEKKNPPGRGFPLN